MRDRTGFTGQDKDGRWFYRYTFTDENGKRRNVRRLATSESNAKSELRKALNRHDKQGSKAIVSERLKFAQLVETYKENRVFAARYQNQVKVAGYRSLAHINQLLDTLTAYFGNKLVRSITHSEIEKFKIERLETLKSNNKPREISSVNRELESLRSVMNYAERNQLIEKSPFKLGATLINKSIETKRERVLTNDEEKRLLNACGTRTYTYKRRNRVTKEIEEVTAHDSGERRKILRVIIICALDTALRRNEIFTLTWGDVDFEQWTITCRAMNSKTARERKVGLTPRLYDELLQLWNLSPKQSHISIFGYEKPNSTIKKSWATVTKIAGLDDFRFHDLRHTAITRLVASGEPSANVMKISGHTQQTTFLRYVNPNTESVRQAAMRLHNFNSTSDDVKT